MFHTLRRVLPRLAVTGTALIALAGRGDNGPDAYEPPPGGESTSPTATPSAADDPTTEPSDPGPTEPILPAAATKNGKKGAEAFVKYYFDVVNYALATGDVVRLTALRDSGCGGCQGGEDSITSVYNRGGRIIGGRLSVAKVHATPESNSWRVTFEATSPPERIRGGAASTSAFRHPRPRRGCF